MEAGETKQAGLPVAVGVALVAAALFGLSTPFAKLLLGDVSPLLLAGLLYLGSEVGLTALYFSRWTPEEAGLKRADLPWLTGAVVCGGMVAPVLLLVGLRLTPASSASLLVGFVGYGLSLACFVLALRSIGTARSGAYFSLAPFVGAAVPLLLLHEPVGPLFVVAALCMGAGVWLHLTERHEHTHERMTHTHRHSHDEHHRHEHATGVDPTEPHTHEHIHEPLTHPHYSDLHYRHGHA